MELFVPIIGAVIMVYYLYRTMNESGKEVEEQAVDVTAMQDAAARQIMKDKGSISL